jgi:hypothetical protein
MPIVYHIGDTFVKGGYKSRGGRIAGGQTQNPSPSPPCPPLPLPTPCLLRKTPASPIAGGNAFARLNEVSLPSYFASEPRLREGGLSDYPQRLRSPSEAKYGAKKGKFEKGSDPLSGGEKQAPLAQGRGKGEGAGGKSREQRLPCSLPSLPFCPSPEPVFCCASARKEGKVRWRKGSAPLASANPPLTVSLSFSEGQEEAGLTFFGG